MQKYSLNSLPKKSPIRQKLSKQIKEQSPSRPSDSVQNIRPKPPPPQSISLKLHSRITEVQSNLNKQCDQLQCVMQEYSKQWKVKSDNLCVLRNENAQDFQALKKCIQQIRHKEDPINQYLSIINKYFNKKSKKRSSLQGNLFNLKHQQQEYLTLKLSQDSQKMSTHKSNNTFYYQKEQNYNSNYISTRKPQKEQTTKDNVRDKEQLLLTQFSNRKQSTPQEQLLQPIKAIEKRINASKTNLKRQCQSYEESIQLLIQRLAEEGINSSDNLNSIKGIRQNSAITLFDQISVIREKSNAQNQLWQENISQIQQQCKALINRERKVRKEQEEKIVKMISNIAEAIF